VALGIVTLTTDFGLRDHYAGVMKGVIASIHPAANVVDICHEARPFCVAQGAFFIAQAYRFFPRGTVHIVVVDPGVGSSRRALLAEAAGQYFVAPDNGVLSQVWEREAHTVRAIDIARHALTPSSNTFHGRDVFAPVGARLSKGDESEGFGSVIEDYVRLEPAGPTCRKPGRWQGRILNIDRFGNLVTSFPAELLRDSPGPIEVAAGKLTTRILRQDYATAAPGQAFVIAGSAGYLELSINQGSAAEAAGADIGDATELTVTQRS